MTRITHTGSRPSTRITALQDGGNRTGVRLIAQLMRVARELWPVKTAAELSARTGVSLRQAEKWLALKANISGEAYARLIRSEEGLSFLEAAAEGAAWFKAYKRQQTISILRTRHATLAREIEAIKQEFSE